VNLSPASRTIAFALLLVGTPAVAAPFTGPARAMDGDSLHVGDKEVRLFGIDAPEFSQPCQRDGREWACGAQAAERLKVLVNGKNVQCFPVGIDQHNRTLAKCVAGDLDINRAMVASGFAVAYRHFSLDYVSAEDTAKAYKRGIWAGTFEMPHKYRGEAETSARPKVPKYRAAPVVSRPQAVVSNGCSIKGNRGSNGWIYHLPGMPFYDRTNAEEMFCSEAQAQAAGYRRAKVR
jgi:endonuclease YncB( thermonuclease family)